MDSLLAADPILCSGRIEIYSSGTINIGTACLFHLNYQYLRFSRVEQFKSSAEGGLYVPDRILGVICVCVSCMRGAAGGTNFQRIRWYLGCPHRGFASSGVPALSILMPFVFLQVLNRNDCERKTGTRKSCGPET